MNNSRQGFCSDAKKIGIILNNMSLSKAAIRGVIAEWALSDAFFESSLGNCFADRLRQVTDDDFAEFRDSVKADCITMETLLGDLDIRGEGLKNPLFTSPMADIMSKCLSRCFEELDPFIRDLCEIQSLVYRYDLNDTSDNDRLYEAYGAGRHPVFASWIGKVFIEGVYARTSRYRADRMKHRAYTAMAAAGVLLFVTSVYGIRSAQYDDIKNDELVREIRETRYAPVASSEAEDAVISPVTEADTEPDTEEAGSVKGPRNASRIVWEEPEEMVEVVAHGAEKEVREEFRALKSLYPDLAGWLKVDAMRIDLPVMQSEKDGYYLNHGITGEEDKRGALFISPETNVSPADDMVVIYGHNMRNGSMFGGVEELVSGDKLKINPYFYFDTLYDGGVYEIIAVVKTRVLKEDEAGFRYYRRNSFNTTGVTEDFAAFIRENALFYAGEPVRDTDKYVILSTCEYSVEQGRLLVIGKKRL